MSLSPIGAVISNGDQITFNVTAFFVVVTLGGAIDITYDPNVLSFAGFSFDSGFLGPIADPALSVLPEDCFTSGSAGGGCAVGDGELNALGFGNAFGISGLHTVGTLTFNATGLGTTFITMAMNDEPLGGFFSAVTLGPQDVQFFGAKVTVVPVPAALWLLLGALGMLGGVRRRG